MPPSTCFYPVCKPSFFSVRHLHYPKIAKGGVVLPEAPPPWIIFILMVVELDSAGACGLFWREAGDLPCGLFWPFGGHEACPTSTPTCPGALIPFAGSPNPLKLVWVYALAPRWIVWSSWASSLCEGRPRGQRQRQRQQQR